SGLNTAKARELLERYEFRTLLGRVGENNSGNDVMSRIEKMYKEGVFSRTIYELEKDLVPVVASMEKAGIAIDPSRFTALGADIQKELEGIEKDVFRMVGTAFNLQSPRQLSEILFVKLDISPKGLHKTPGGVVSTASPELQKLKETHPVVAKVLKWRELAKLLNTYVEPLPAMADQNNRIHAHFDQLGAATGRMSSSEPNLQNIPMQGDWAKKIRKGFIAQEGRKFVACDYSQMELRIIAHLAKEPKMQRVFREGRDIHALTAAEIFGVPADKVTPQLRYRAKALNFGIIYGMGARGFAESAGVSLGEAEDFIENYFLRFPKIHEYMEATKEFAHKNGYVQTMWGRKRYLPDIDSSTPRIRAAAERAAINHPVQGSAADIIKKAMVEVFKTFSSQEGVRMILQLHDELLFEIKSEMIALCLGPIRHAMETACRLDIPLVVEASTGTSWGDMIPMVQ
ncbi:MAG: DNA polymerase I, partial [Candidatus Wildermuthbacteria bacterium]|nr:DNA polymerase I [Candidatus Wildermuthbacteria bacterium]